MTEHRKFPKIPRLFRECTITEKIDGTNALVHITDDNQVFAGSRNRWITPEDDNYGFAKFVRDNADALLLLGPGFHYGEWWGAGINRGYDERLRHFSLFFEPRVMPLCCRIVPHLLTVEFDSTAIYQVMEELEESGSRAAPGYMKPEGIVVNHIPSRNLYKYTFDGDARKGATV